MSAATAARLRVGAELRRLREGNGLSGEVVAERLGWSQAKVSRVEAGRVAHALPDVAALVTLYGASDDLRAEMLSSVAQETGDGAWLVRAGGPGPRQGSLATMEVTAARLRQYHGTLVPGLLQTRAYAEVVVSLVGVNDPVAVAAARIRRQEAALDAKLKMDFIVDARVLLADIGDTTVLAAQARHLADVGSSRRHVTLKVVPLGAPLVAVSTVPFSIYDFRVKDVAPVVLVEAPTADMYVSAAADVKAYVDLLRRLAIPALAGRDSVDYFTRIADEIESGTWLRNT